MLSSIINVRNSWDGIAHNTRQFYYARMYVRTKECIHFIPRRTFRITFLNFALFHIIHFPYFTDCSILLKNKLVICQEVVYFKIETYRTCHSSRIFFHHLKVTKYYNIGITYSVSKSLMQKKKKSQQVLYAIPFHWLYYYHNQNFQLSLQSKMMQL